MKYGLIFCLNNNRVYTEDLYETFSIGIKPKGLIPFFNIMENNRRQ